jgi:hypothetical protein
MINASAAFLCQRADVYQDFSILPHVAGLEIPLGELYIPALEKPKSSASEMEIIGTWKGRWTPVSGAQASEVVLSINVRGGELVVEEANLRSGGPAEKEDYAKFEDNRLTFKQSTPNGSWVELNLKYGKLKGGAYPSDLGLPRTKEEGKIYDLEFMRSY